MRSPWAPSAAGVFLWTIAVWGFARAEIGSVIENVEMATITGERAHVLSNAAVNVFIFFKPGQEHSRATMKQVAACQHEMAGKSVHWAAIVSDRVARAEVEDEVRRIGLAMPVFVDAGDAFYGRLGTALTPVAGITDRNHKLLAYLPFAKVNYGLVLSAHIRHALKEIGDEALGRALHPPSATQGGDAEVARRRLKLAEKLFQGGNYEKALESANKSLEKDPTAAAYALLGRILAAQRHRAEALKAFEQALTLEPTNTLAREGKKALQEEGK